VHAHTHTHTGEELTLDKSTGASSTHILHSCRFL